jgi:hypothetical protein
VTAIAGVAALGVASVVHVPVPASEGVLWRCALVNSEKGLEAGYYIDHNGVSEMDLGDDGDRSAGEGGIVRVELALEVEKVEG